VRSEGEGEVKKMDALRTCEMKMQSTKNKRCLFRPSKSGHKFQGTAKISIPNIEKEKRIFDFEIFIFRTELKVK
jgi:hypothetical protein